MILVSTRGRREAEHQCGEDHLLQVRHRIFEEGRELKRRNPTELVDKQEEKQGARQETGHGEANGRKEPTGEIPYAVLIERADDAQGQGDDAAYDDGEGRKFERDRQGAAKVAEDRGPGDQRLAAVEPDEVPEPAAVLHHERVVEAELVAKLLVLDRVDGAASIVGEDVEGDVAGEQTKDQEDRERDDDHRRDDQQEAVDQIALHGEAFAPQLFNDAAPLLMRAAGPVDCPVTVGVENRAPLGRP